MKAVTKHIFFDLDHTLWDFEKNSALTFKYVFDKYSVDIPFDRFIEAYVPINVRYWKLFRDDKITQQELRLGRLREALGEIGHTVTDDMLQLLSDEYVLYLPNFNYLYDGAVEVLEYLKTKYTLHIITNGFHHVQAGKIKNSNLEQYFDTITNSDLAGCKKPNPIIFEFALNAAKAKKESSIMIGDCIEADVQGALNCGIAAIYFNEHKLQAPDSILQVNHLLELKNIL